MSRISLPGRIRHFELIAKRCQPSPSSRHESLNIRLAANHCPCRHLSTERPNNSRIFLSTSVKKSFSVPLTLADVHLRDEQLPFAYAFRETLDADRLVTSLQEVLQRYPILGATTDFSEGKVPTLVCTEFDSVPFSIGQSDLTLDEWFEQKRTGHMQHMGWKSGGGAPTLSPLFDDLMSSKWVWEGINEEKDSMQKYGEEHVATVRITYFKGGGTAIGINLSHMLGDANSCFRICQVWGRAMRGLSHPLGASNSRAKATLTGMVTPEIALLLNLGSDRSKQASSKTNKLYNQITSYLKQLTSATSEDTGLEREGADSSILSDREHEYVRLEFSRELLSAMKAFGISHCQLYDDANSQDENENTKDIQSFVSTNDLITAMGWMIKRSVSEKPDWNLSMVVNLRKRGGIDDFGCLEDPNLRAGVLGNALTSVVAKVPASDGRDITLVEICNAAMAIRKSLTKKMSKIEELQSLSRSGRAAQASNQGSCFSNTSWMQFPLWGSIRFSDKEDNSGSLDGFMVDHRILFHTATPIPPSMCRHFQEDARLSYWLQPEKSNQSLRCIEGSQSNFLRGQSQKSRLLEDVVLPRPW